MSNHSPTVKRGGWDSERLLLGKNRPQVKQAFEGPMPARYAYNEELKPGPRHPATLALPKCPPSRSR